ncbi:glycosyltransferase family 1 protein [Telmatobacter sp. DSM 110680]|uniref:Glycosyltransferase family 1 protein n=1 Tax=Telmatobacter sp. DSM 110680 TaxID=3036704 RepID=A0AAU7DDH1_9BACT
MIKVGIIASLRGMWQGGVNYYKNLWSCYQQNPDPAVKLAIFTPHPEDVSCYECDAIEVHPWPEMTSRPPWNYPRRATRRIIGYDPAILKFLKRHRVDLLSHCEIGKQTSINTLWWQPDFQHKVFPKYFSRKECAYRDSIVANTKRWGNILLSSNAAANDFRRFYPELASVRPHVLRFSCAAIVDMVSLSREELAAHYPVIEPYFFLPNQFWQHKNHRVVIEALRQVSPKIRVICTGPMDDRRDPGYVPGLMAKVKEFGLEERFICLGTVPYNILVSLMHHSLAVVQPSMFEGWSTSVEESKAMCKQIVLSNIDVHREQAPERGVYFSPESPEELATCLTRLYFEFSPATELIFANQRSHFKTRIEREWIEQFSQIMKTVARGH